jgi:NADP-dependent aldehyde dehydrogenase
VVCVAGVHDEGDAVPCSGHRDVEAIWCLQSASVSGSQVFDHRGSDETGLPGDLTRRLLSRAGRIVYDGYPTGVAVAWAQHHGGPWPATNTQHPSVGATSIHRFLRLVAWQNAPAELLPVELRDDCRDIPRRVDGVAHPAVSASGQQ